MVNGANLNRRDRTAIALSIALHCCALALLWDAIRTAAPEQTPDERAIVASLIRIEQRSAPHGARSRGGPPAGAAATLARRAPILNVAQADSRADGAQLVPAENRYQPPKARARAAAAFGAPPPGPHRALVGFAVTPPAATPTPVPTPAVSATPAAVAVHDDAIGNFGENYPAKVDPQARGALFDGVAGAVVLRVMVDESGRVTAVDFVHAPDDPALKEELRARLLATRFIPAACNGLRCADTVELHN
jgi:hypothetical protein